MTAKRKYLFLATLAGVLLLLAFLGMGIERLRYELRSYSVLRHFLDPAASGPLLRAVTFDVYTEDFAMPTKTGPVHARIYLPVGITHPQGIVVVHGIHRLGIDEPRLVNFSRALAGSGFAVLTPEIAALADYHVDADSIATIGESTQWLAEKLGERKVTLVGISFAGGLSLMVASDPRYEGRIRAVAVMGAYDDLNRVSRFLVTNRAELPDGTSEPYTAYEYGALVFVYAHLGQFFPAGDMPAAHEALKYWLWEQPQNAQPWLPKLSPEGQAMMQKMFSHHVDDMRAEILARIKEDEAELTAISPEGKMGNLRVPVYILHGSTDDIIPSTESLWLERDVPRGEIAEALITPAFAHVDPEKTVDMRDELQLVDFIARFLRAAAG
jgi:pimeloyl-ACP methyl ester carboxylesterase